ncbi:metallophosphoesterase [Argonema antarcticum]|uniref:metallophosphoesterase n=1 Tax=Argonema antarcticum TaxID=2942763 RepID=UPI002012BF0F|nr:metallophosphoesterase [Argonema antarcticum]MCL1473013.1 hypothetical protein [Argonema antarcticum A004/B2]
MSLKINLLYNSILIVADIAVLLFFRRKQTAWTLCACVGLLTLMGLFLAVLLGENLFGIARLIGYGIFLHGFIIWSGLAIALRRSVKKIAIACAVIAVIIGGIGIDAFAIEPYWLEVSHVRLSTPKLANPIKIVAIADFQTDVWGEYERQTLLKAIDRKADLILLPGDYIQLYNTSRREKLRNQINTFLKEINFGAKFGVYAVEGDQEFYQEWPHIFDGLPVKVFQNSGRVVMPEICITGLTLNDSRNPQLEIPECGGKFHIAFGHAPDFALGNINADLLVAGHTHGGQVRLPFIGPVIKLSRVPRKWAAGVTDIGDGRTLIVSRGVGMERGAAPRLRFLCRPELVVIDLVPA